MANGKDLNRRDFVITGAAGLTALGGVSFLGRPGLVMGANDRAAALRENETRYRAKSYDGGIKPAAKVPADVAIALEDNFTLMGRFGMSGTPALIWKDSKGQVQTHLGLPPLSRLPAITGLPEQKIDDPELAKFRR